MPRKIRQLVKDLQDAGFQLVSGAGKGSHRKFTHPNYAGAVTLSGRDGDDRASKEHPTSGLVEVCYRKAAYAAA